MRYLKWAMLVTVCATCVGVLLVGLRGCSVAPVSFAKRNYAGSLDLPLSGRYEVAIHSFLTGTIRGRIAAEASTDRTSFVANSRPGVAWSMIGGIESALGPIVMPSLFPGGVIVVWESGLPGPDERGVLVPGVGRFGAGKEFSVESRLSSPDEPVELFYQDRRIGIVTLKKIEDAHAAAGANAPDSTADVPAKIDDEADAASRRAMYRRIADAIEASMRDRLYDPALAGSSQVSGYIQKVRSVAATSRDDLEFAFGANLAWRNTLKFSQVGVLRQLDGDAASTLQEGPAWEKSLLRLSFADFSGNPLDPTSEAWIAGDPGQGRVAIITCTWFASIDDIDRLMRQVIERHRATPLDGLILDMKSCFGGSLAALRFAEWLCDEPADVAAMYHHRAKARLNEHGLDGLPRVSPSDLGWKTDMGTVFSDNLDALRSAIEPEGAAVLAITPVASDMRFDKPVGVLISRRTAGPAEALAEMLQRTKRALLIGGRTGGRMLVPQRVDLGEGWILQLPAFDYATPDGRRIEGKPIEPDISISGGKAKGEALRQIRAILQNETQPRDEGDRREPVGQ